MKWLAFQFLQMIGYLALAAGTLIGGLVIYALAKTIFFNAPVVGPDTSMGPILSILVFVFIAGPLFVLGLLASNRADLGLKSVRKNTCEDQAA